MTIELKRRNGKILGFFPLMLNYREFKQILTDMGLRDNYYLPKNQLRLFYLHCRKWGLTLKIVRHSPIDKVCI